MAVCSFAAATKYFRLVERTNMNPQSHPYSIFCEWYKQAHKSEQNSPNAMSLSTVSESGVPSTRIVLLKDHHARGFIFYTNLKSQKSIEIRNNPNVCLCFHWKSINKQIRITGVCHQVPDTLADQYFSTRPRLSQLGAWASKQSQPMKTRFDLEKRVAEYTTRFHVAPIKRPEFWSGFEVTPFRFEFWVEKPFRLHERFIFEEANSQWTFQRLYP